MKLLQVFVVMLTVLLFLVRQIVFAGVCPRKRRILPPYFCGDGDTHTHRSRNLVVCARACNECDGDLAMPKYKRDPKISVDNEDLDSYPVD